MIECIFTLDYEVYGNGTGSLNELVFEPAERLKEIFLGWNARFVAFVEAAEFEQIEAQGTDPAIEPVRCQIHDLHRRGFEIGLHLHPQWCNARHKNGHWILDTSEYNLCTLSISRIREIVAGSLNYLRYVLDGPSFTPLAFRAGNWLFQPTANAARVLTENGIRIDSSVFKGGLQHNHALDFRAALRNGYYWTFSDRVTQPDPAGRMLEIPIHTEMVPVWKMATSKRLGLSGPPSAVNTSFLHKLNRARDLLRLLYPLKLDFCRMTLNELTSMMDRVIRQDSADPSTYRPIVAIGHTKDLRDPDAVEAFLAYLSANRITVATFESSWPRMLPEEVRAVLQR